MTIIVSHVERMDRMVDRIDNKITEGNTMDRVVN
jgi:hypothetical protein